MIQTGIGIYPRPDAARLLDMSPARLRRWVSGYTYWLKNATDEQSALRARPPVIQTDIPVIDHFVALSFLELMELRVVKALVDAKLSLQHIRQAGRAAAESFGTTHPFASRRIFTDGKSIVSAMSDQLDAPDVVRWKNGEIDQIVSGKIFEQFLSEIEFDEATGLTNLWWPLGKEVPVVLNPRVCFGAPTIRGRALRTSAVAMMGRLSVEEAADAYEITSDEVEAAVGFEDMLAATG